VPEGNLEHMKELIEEWKAKVRAHEKQLSGSEIKKPGTGGKRRVKDQAERKGTRVDQTSIRLYCGLLDRIYALHPTDGPFSHAHFAGALTGRVYFSEGLHIRLSNKTLCENKRTLG
jgi:hypothetical protein